MSPFSRGMLSLISPVDFPSYKSEEDLYTHQTTMGNRQID